MRSIGAFLTLWCLALAAQVPQPLTVKPVASPAAEPSQRATSSVSVGYVLVPFVVTDTKGRTIGDLRAKDVTLLVDGRAVATDLFDRSDRAPVSFAILLDGSGSMGLGGKMEGARAALRALVSRRIPGDDFALYVFAEGQVREAVPFTSDVAKLTRALDAVVPFGRTALFDAIAKMPDRSLLGKNGARAILLLTDGIDNASRLSEPELTALLEGIDVPVYPLGLRGSEAVGTPPPGFTKEALLNLDVLGHIARMSGGRLEIVTEPEQLDGAVREIERDLRTQYVLGFTPTGSGTVRYHRLSLRLGGRPRVVRVRAGYRGTDPPFLGRGAAH
jgi:Ca-activated chloride channel family protein